MKQTLNNIRNGLLALLLFSIAMLVIGTGCSPKLGKNIEVLPARTWGLDSATSGPTTDTITWLKFKKIDGSIAWVNLDSLINGSGKVVIDTIVFAGESYEFHDSIPCPEGLKKDSTVYVTFTKILPARAVPVSVAVMDTIWLTKTCPDLPPAAPLIFSDGTGWGERAAWIAGLAALLLGYWNQYRTRKTNLA